MNIGGVDCRKGLQRILSTAVIFETVLLFQVYAPTSRETFNAVEIDLMVIGNLSPYKVCLTEQTLISLLKYNVVASCKLLQLPLKIVRDKSPARFKTRKSGNGAALFINLEHGLEIRWGQKGCLDFWMALCYPARFSLRFTIIKIRISLIRRDIVENFIDLERRGFSKQISLNKSEVFFG